MASIPLRRNREFALLWIGQGVSSLGSQISLVAYPLLVLATTGSPARAGIVGFAQQAPIALLALPAGALADRVDRKRLMIASDAVRGLALATLPIALAAGGLPYPLIVAVALLDGTGFVTTYVAERGVVRQLVAPEQLGEAVARNESRMFAAALAGPPLGGLLFGIGRALPFTADAVSYIAAAASKLLIRSPFQARREVAQRGRLGDGVRWLWRRPFFRTCSLLFAASNPIYTGISLLIVVLAKRHGASATLIGVMLALAAGGGLIGALLAPALQRRLSPRAVLVGEAFVLAAALPLLAVVRSAPLLGLIVGAAELITPVTNSIIVGLRVALAPDELQGRVQAASTMISFSAGWAGPLSVGFLLQNTSATATVLALTGVALVLAFVAVTARSFRNPPVDPGREAAPATS